MNLEELGWNPFFSANFNEQSGLTPARIILEQKSEYTVMTEAGIRTAKLAGKIRFNSKFKHELPAIGDWVGLRLIDDNSTIIEMILPRKTQLVRVASGSRKRQNINVNDEQAIGVNIDTIFIVTDLDQDFNPRRIERYLTLVYNSGANPVILLNKSDLCDDANEKLLEIEAVAFTTPVHVLSAKKDTDLDILRQYLGYGQTTALIGSSGVGKSTIINKLIGYEKQKTGELSVSVGKGQHTTSHREMIFLPEGGIIIDNPGMREISLSADKDDVNDAFQDIEEYAIQCRFKDCKHQTEPDCAVKQAIMDGKLELSRMESYHKMIREVRYYEEKKSLPANYIDKQKWKKLFQGK